MPKEVVIVNNNKLIKLLKQNGLSITDSRRKILQLFLEQDGALAHGDIEKIILFAMHYVRMNVAKAIIMTIIFILCVIIVIPLIV